MGKQEGKKLTKTKNKHQRRTASPSPSGGGDVRGNGGIWVAEQVSNTASLSPKVVPPQAPPKEGMCLTGYKMLGVGERAGGRNQT